MRELFLNSTFFGVVLTVGAFVIGGWISRKTRFPLCNPILIGAGLVMLVLWGLDIPLEVYRDQCRILSYLMTPATICLAIAFYEQLRGLKGHLPAILIGVAAGTVASLGSVWLLCRLFGLDDTLTASLLPKSVTTAIGVVLSEGSGGVGALTTTVIILTGILGNVAGPLFSKLFGLKDPVSQGVAYGTASHVIGTSRAVEISGLTGAVSSLSLTLSGLLTALFYSIFM